MQRIRNRRMEQVKQRRVGSGLGMVTNFAFGFLLHENLCINNNNNLHYQFDSPSFSLFISQLSHCLSFSPLSSSPLLSCSLGAVKTQDTPFPSSTPPFIYHFACLRYIVNCHCRRQKSDKSDTPRPPTCQIRYDSGIAVTA